VERLQLDEEALRRMEREGADATQTKAQAENARAELHAMRSLKNVLSSRKTLLQLLPASLADEPPPRASEEEEAPFPRRMPCLFINHGIGPLPLMGRQPAIASPLKAFASTLAADQQPTAVVVISAHWESSPPAIGSAQFPRLIFDYDGFGLGSYKYKYPAPGAPVVAERIRLLLAGAGIRASVDAGRGWDQCVFVPMMLAFPRADVPLVEVSVHAGQDAAAHVAMGRALAPLREEGVLIVGSGNSFYNLDYFFSDDPVVRREGISHCSAFNDWLRASMTEHFPTPEARLDRLRRWAELAPSAREAHGFGSAAHLMPLFVVAGAALGEIGSVFGAVGNPSQPEKDPMRGFVLSCFEFRDRFRVRLRITSNAHLFLRASQPVLVDLRIVPDVR